ncbi:T9SS type A sorting domain-containing protein [bacterium]|nr:T9SS type A sorting domain-containing protein [bacterium]
MRNAILRKKKKQLKEQAKQLNHLLQSHHAHAAHEVKRMVSSIKLLLLEIKEFLAQYELKKILGAAALLFGLAAAPEANAQVFKTGMANPFGMDTSKAFAIPTFADLDGDGDFDMLVAEYQGVWEYYENTGTASAPDFASSVANPFGLKAATIMGAPNLVDIDGDGDFDLLAGEYYGNFEFFENIGTSSGPQFARPQKNALGLSKCRDLVFPTIADLDGDGDYDVLAGEFYGNFQYFENTGSKTNPQFAAQVKNPFGLDSLYGYNQPNLADIDNDGDFDVLACDYYGVMYFFENTGTATAPAFKKAVPNAFNLNNPDKTLAFPTTVDLDNDGDLDVLVGTLFGIMRYYENVVFTSTPALAPSNKLAVYPNPAGSVVQIDCAHGFEKVEIYDLPGHLVQTHNSGNPQLQIGHLPPGVYLLRIFESTGIVSTRRITKQ